MHQSQQIVIVTVLRDHGKAGHHFCRFRVDPIVPEASKRSRAAAAEAKRHQMFLSPIPQYDST